MEQVFSHTVRITTMEIRRAPIVLRQECLTDMAANPTHEESETAIAPIRGDMRVHLKLLVWQLAMEERAI